AKQYGEIFDTISVCLSKGLGCPIGSILIGDKAIMENAIRIRKIFGGAMRQVGYLAAAGLFALDNNMERLAEDHRKAKEIGVVLSQLPIIKIVEPIETNIIIFELNENIDETAFVQKLADNNVKIIGMGGGKLRIVTHLDYTEKMHENVLDTIDSLNF
ncbi:MAG: threonine aldolase, partial [Bacteroidetes bacterium]|nr:threonine aldolase [Bacteroidota bacterium]